MQEQSNQPTNTENMQSKTNENSTQFTTNQRVPAGARIPAGARPPSSSHPTSSEQPINQPNSPAGARPPAGARTPAGARHPSSEQSNTKPTAPSGARPPSSEQSIAKPNVPAGARPPAGVRAGQPKGGAQQSAGSHQIKFLITKFSPTYLQKWNCKQETCEICRNNLYDPCMHCDTKGDTDPCPPTEGQCGHIFHAHCIQKWISQNPTCPKCQETWAVKDTGDDDTM